MLSGLQMNSNDVFTLELLPSEWSKYTVPPSDEDCIAWRYNITLVLSCGNAVVYMRFIFVRFSIVNRKIQSFEMDRPCMIGWGKWVALDVFLLTGESNVSYLVTRARLATASNNIENNHILTPCFVQYTVLR